MATGCPAVAARKKTRESMYGLRAGHPLAAMPSLHFATSLMAARPPTGAGPLEGATGRTRTGLSGFALLHPGEHYAVDVVAGTPVTEAVHRAALRVPPAAEVLSRTGRRLAARAQGEWGAG